MKNSIKSSSKTTDKADGFFFIHGGGMGSWVWEKLLPLVSLPSYCIEERVDPVRFPNLRKVRISDIVDHAVNAIKKTGLSRVIVVGHSGAGFILYLIAERIPDLISHLVFVAASLPPQDKRTIDILPFPIRMMNLLAVLLMSYGVKMSPKKREESIRRYFGNDCDEETIQFMLAHRMSSEPPAVVREKIRRLENITIPKTYIRLSKDKTAPLALQDEMIANCKDARTVTIDSGHMVMLSRPNELAEELNLIAKISE